MCWGQESVFLVGANAKADMKAEFCGIVRINSAAEKTCDQACVVFFDIGTMKVEEADSEFVIDFIP